MKRYKLSKRKNKKLFKRTANKIHKKNLAGNIKRGGIRL